MTLECSDLVHVLLRVAVCADALEYVRFNVLF